MQRERPCHAPTVPQEEVVLPHLSWSLLPAALARGVAAGVRGCGAWCRGGWC